MNSICKLATTFLLIVATVGWSSTLNAQSQFRLIVQTPTAATIYHPFTYVLSIENIGTDDYSGNLVVGNTIPAGVTFTNWGPLSFDNVPAGDAYGGLFNCVAYGQTEYCSGPYGVQLPHGAVMTLPITLTADGSTACASVLSSFTLYIDTSLVAAPSPTPVLLSGCTTKYTVTPIFNPHVVLSPGAVQQIPDGGHTTFTVTTDAGYTPQVLGTCGGTLSGNQYTTNLIDANCTVEATAYPNSFTVTPVATAHITISPSAPFNVSSVSSNTVTMTPDVGYLAYFGTGMTCGGFSEGGGATGTPIVLTLNGVSSDCTVAALAVPNMVTTATPNPAILGQEIDLVATIGGDNPSGTVDFYPEVPIGTFSTPPPLCSNVVVVANRATCHITPQLVAGDHALSTVFNPSGTTIRVPGGVHVIVFANGFYPNLPERLLDTRLGATTYDGLDAGAGAVPGGTWIDLAISSRFPVPYIGAIAAVLNVTATNSTLPGYVTVWPTGSPRPTASTLNLIPGQTVPNLVIAKIGDNGKVSLFNSAGTTDLIADLLGYFSIASAYTPLQPSRLLDTRAGTHTIDGEYSSAGALGAGAALDLGVSGRGGVPTSGADLVALNVTATNATAAGYVTVWPSDAPRPRTSNLNVIPGDTHANLILTKLSSSGHVSLFNSAGNTDLVADVVGWYAPTSEIQSVTASRLMDTRHGFATTDGQYAGTGALSPGAQLDLLVAGRGGVPASGAGSVVLNVTVTDPTAAGFVTVWNSSYQRPVASNLNFIRGQTIPNLVIAQLDSNGTVSIFNSAGSTDIVVDVLQWFPADPPEVPY